MAEVERALARAEGDLEGAHIDAAGEAELAAGDEAIRRAGLMSRALEAGAACLKGRG